MKLAAARDQVEWKQKCAVFWELRPKQSAGRPARLIDHQFKWGRSVQYEDYKTREFARKRQLKQLNQLNQWPPPGPTRSQLARAVCWARRGELATAPEDGFIMTIGIIARARVSLTSGRWEIKWPFAFNGLGLRSATRFSGTHPGGAPLNLVAAVLIQRARYSSNRAHALETRQLASDTKKKVRPKQPVS